MNSVLPPEQASTELEAAVDGVRTAVGHLIKVVDDGALAAVAVSEVHHDDVPHESAESVLVQAADSISGSRPGARREAFETYVKRLTRLEEIANGFSGVEKSNVIQAGREIRVVVTPERIDDGAAAQLSESIARKIESELQYPGQIKVVVIRETRAVDFAR